MAFPRAKQVIFMFHIVSYLILKVTCQVVTVYTTTLVLGSVTQRSTFSKTQSWSCLFR